MGRMSLFVLICLTTVAHADKTPVGTYRPPSVTYTRLGGWTPFENTDKRSCGESSRDFLKGMIDNLSTVEVDVQAGVVRTDTLVDAKISTQDWSLVNATIVGKAKAFSFVVTELVSVVKSGSILFAVGLSINKNNSWCSDMFFTTLKHEL